MNKIEQRMIDKILEGGQSNMHFGICTNTVLRIYNTNEGWCEDQIDVSVHGKVIACYYPYLGPVNSSGVIYLYATSSKLVTSRVNALIKGLGFDLNVKDNGVFWEFKI